MMTLTSEAADKPVMTLDFKKAHQVYKNAQGKRVPGVTTILGMLDKPALVHWAWKLGTEGIDYKKQSGEACDIGTVGHALSECHAKGMELDESNIPPAILDKAQTTYIKFAIWWDNEGFEVIDAERQMVSEMLQVGGTADLVARNPKGEVCLIDLKTSKALYRENRIQVSTYAEMYEEITGTHIDRVFLVRIGKEDVEDFEVREVFDRSACFDAFEKLRDCYEALKAVKQ